MSSSRQGIRLCGRLHREYVYPGGHSALLRCWVHLHHLFAPNAVSWCQAVNPSS